MPLPTLGQVARNFVADTAKLAADGGGFWDAITLWLIDNGWVHNTPRSRAIWFGLLSYLGATARANLNDRSILGNTAQELIGDAASELTKRFHEHFAKVR